ncbi:MAG: hypothetical protein ACR2LM_07440 [Pyrinomonadaceae bacterium]
MRANLQNPTHKFTFLLPLTVLAFLLLVFTGIAQTPNTQPAEGRGVIRLRVRVKTGETTKGLSRKRFYLIRGTVAENKALLQATEERTAVSRDCYYRSLGASEALIRWLREGDCESVYCREIEAADLEGNNAVPEFQRALLSGEQELASRDLARKWLTVNLPENIRDGFYKARQRELQKLIRQAEDTSGSKVLSVMTDTRGTAYFTDLPLGTYVVSSLLPTENANSNIVWNCEVEVKPGDLANEKPYLISNVRERNVKCVGSEKPLPVCAPARQGGD